MKNEINWKKVDPAYELRIRQAVEQYFGRKKQPKRTAAPLRPKQGQKGTTGWLF